MAEIENIERLIRGLETGDEGALQGEFNALFADENRGFGEGFADRVMERIQSESREKGMDYFLPRLFRWVALAGVAAAVALLLMTYLADDGLSLDSLSGISQVSVEEVASINI